ncbi:MAG: hypothetical protein U0487_01865 [Patescibacteria group bacterium]
MPQKQEGVHRLTDSQADAPRPRRLPIVEVDLGRNPKQRGEPLIEVLGKPADRTKERA